MSFDLPKAVRQARRLSPRQLEVLRGLAEGKQRKELADHMGLAAKTVDSYCEIIFHRLGAHKTSEVVRVACAAGLV